MITAPPSARFVPGEGPRPCPLMFVGEGPGKEEDRLGRPFVGQTGKVLDGLLARIGLDRGKIYLTNLVKYRVPGDGDPTRADIRRDEAELQNEIWHTVRPHTIVTLGRWSTRYFLGNVDMYVVNGVPHQRIIRHGSGIGLNLLIIFPIIHPAAGLHSTEEQGRIWWGFQRLKMLLDGKIGRGAPRDEYPNPEYSSQGKGGYARWRASVVAIDTEGTAARPWGGSYASEPGRACAFQYRPGMKLTVPPGEVILFNAMHDLAVLRAMGIALRPGQFTDNMVKAFLLCVEPQGLKELARRHCGMEMESFEDLVAGPSRQRALDYLLKVAEWLDKQSANASSGSSTTALGGERTPVHAGRGSARTSRKK